MAEETINKNLGHATAYAYAKAGGYTGTEAQFTELLGNIGIDLEQIENLQVVVNTLPEGSQATASYSNGVLTLGIPRGNTGATGATGAKGDKGDTGNGIASITLTSTVGSVKTYTITFTDGTTTTFEVTDGEITEEILADILSDYAQINGYYEELTSGSAEQLLSDQYVEDSVPYNFRTSGGSADIGNRKEIEHIEGLTVAWNQLVNGSSVTIPNGHKYFANIGGVKTVATSNGTAIAIDDSNKDNIHDLTQMFGSTIADHIYSLEQAETGKGVALFKSMFPKDYYPYNAGELMSCEPSFNEMVGFNQFDFDGMDVYQGTFDAIGGAANVSTGEYMPILPSTTYCWHENTYINGRYIRFYDSNKNFIEGSQLSFYTALDVTFTTPSNASYMRLMWYSANGLTVDTIKNDEVNINLSWSGTHNGEYESYKVNKYEFNPVTLRGIPKLVDGKITSDGDRRYPDGTVERRYGIVDLGSLSWQTSTLHGITTFIAWPPSWVGGNDSVCVKYTNGVFSSSMADKTIALSRYWSSSPRIVIRDDAYNDATAFKTAMSGVNVIFMRLTPTEETADPYDEVMLVNDWGTERFNDYQYDQGNRAVEIPVGHNTDYMPNLRDKLQHLPDLADSDGAYLIRQTGTSMELDLFRIPKAPTTDGTYTLKATVSGGTPTYAWEAVE